MIDALLPAGVVAVEAFDDRIPAPLFPQEELLVVKAVDKRRREFATGRRCAREALAALGHPPAPLLRFDRGGPAWPPGVVGSITHCPGYRAAAVAPAARAWSIGIDAEPNEPLPEGVLERVTSPAEREMLADLLARGATVRWDRLLFSVKESVYKVCFPLIGQFMEFSAAEVTIDEAGGCTARLTVDGPVIEGWEVTVLNGRWLSAGGLLLSAIALTNPLSAPEPHRAARPRRSTR
jgi:enterobactin synthetase component D / holo-[acyl-carrier protein] synthase